MLYTKIKRSLIPMTGKGLSYLFGTATDAYSNTICSSVSRLAESQEEIAHVVDENVSVINIMRVKIQKIDKLGIK